MATIVTLDIFSGRPNPTWILSPSQIITLKEKLSELKERTFHKIPKTYHGLGYRGFIIKSLDINNLPEKLLVCANIIDFGGSSESFLDHENNFELWLLETAGQQIDDNLKDIAREAIQGERNSIDFFTNNPDLLTSAPPYTPNWWNDDYVRREYNNCYNYACNYATNTFAQPGRGSGQIFNQLDCNDIGNAAVRDGLYSIQKELLQNGSQQYVALVIAPNQDFHWYRQDDNGYWSHKPGSTDVINYDQNYQLITNPQTAARGIYTVFCGYYYVDNQHITIQ